MERRGQRREVQSLAMPPLCELDAQHTLVLCISLIVCQRRKYVDTQTHRYWVLPQVELYTITRMD